MCVFTLLLLKKARLSSCPDIKGNSFQSRVFFQPEISQSCSELIWVVETLSCERVYADERDDVRVPVIPLK